MTILRRLARDISQVDALAESVAIDGSFGRGDAQTLGQDAAVVGGAGAVPEQAPVAFLELGELGGGEAGGFAVAVDAEDVFEAEADVVGRAGGFDEVVG